MNSEFALKFTGRQLPDWGFNQHEVASDRLVDQSDSVWNVEEHRYTKSEDQKQRERELINAEMIPLKATSLSFWQKFIELQIKMLFNSQEAQNTHMYASSPFEWPFMTRGIAYWVSSESNVSNNNFNHIYFCSNQFTDNPWCFRPRFICLEMLQYGILGHSF